MGFSVLSLIEIIYFVTLRPYCKSVQHHRSKANNKSKVHHSQQESGIAHSNGVTVISPSGYRRNSYDPLQFTRNKTDLVGIKLNRHDMRTHQRNEWNNYLK